MKIAFDHQIFSSQRYGGISRYFVELCLSLLDISSSTSTQIVAPLFVNNYLQQSRKCINHYGLHCPSFRGSHLFYSVLNRYLSHFPLACYNPDIVHSTYYSLPSQSSKRYKKVLTVYDMIHEIYPALFASTDRTSIIKRKAVESSDHIICISQSTKNDLIHYFNVDPSKVSVVYLGVRNNPSEVAAYKHGRPYLLYVGSRYGYKNFKKFLQAYCASNFLRSHYDVICFGGGSFSFTEQKFFHSIQLSLRNLHNIQGSDCLLKSLYLGASCLVYPSLYEGFGIPPLEAMHYGCPVICSNSSSLPEVVGSSAILFNPQSTLSIKISIESTLSQPSLVDDIISSGKDHSQSFSWQKCARHTLDIYSSLL